MNEYAVVGKLVEALNINLEPSMNRRKLLVLDRLHCSENEAKPHENMLPIAKIIAKFEP
jgi:hypothetical protein